MFSQNGKISERQLFRLIVAESLGTLMLILPDLAGNGQTGMAALLTGGVFTFLHLWFVRYLTKKCDRSRPSRGLLAAAGLITVLKCFILGTLLLLQVEDVVEDVLLQGQSAPLIMAVWAAASVYLAMKGIEARGRMGEASFYLVTVPLLALLLLCFWHIGKATSGMGVMGTPVLSLTDAAKDWQGVLLQGLWYSICFSHVELLFWERGSLSLDEHLWKTASGAILFVWVISFLFTAAAVGILGVSGIQNTEHSLMAVAGCLDVTGAVVMQQQGIVLLFFLLSILMASGALLFHTASISRQIFGKRMILGWGVLIWVCAVALNGYGKAQGSAGSMEAEGGSAASKAETSQKALGTKAEIEDRAYCICIAVDPSEDGMYRFTLEIAEGTEITSSLAVYEAENLGEAAQQFNADEDKELDVSHLQVLLLGNGMRDEGAFEHILESFGSSDVYFGSTLLAFTERSGLIYLEDYTRKQETAGIHLRKRFEQGMKEEKTELSAIYYEWLNAGKNPTGKIMEEIPVVD